METVPQTGCPSVELDASARLRRRSSVRARKLGNKYFLHDSRSRLPEGYETNEIGLLIWRGLDGSNDLEAVAATAAARFELDLETARRDCIEFVAELLKEGLVEVVAE